MKFNEKSKRVRQIQDYLNLQGYHLKVDGHLGQKTWDAIDSLADAKDWDWEPELNSNLVENLLSRSGSNLEGSTFYDLRDLPVPFDKASRFKMVQNKVQRRDITRITGIVLHQTGIEFSVNKRQVDEADGDKNKALAMRAKGIPTHAVAFENFFVKNYPLDFYCYHANALNRTTLGLEVDGKYPGRIVDERTTHTVFTKARREAAEEALRWLYMEGLALGMPIKYIYAHRQSSKTRRADPGEELWHKLVEEFAVPKLGLEPRYGFTIGEGRTIPIDWNPRDGKGLY